MGFHEYPEWPASIGTIMGATGATGPAGPAGATGASGQTLLIPGPRFFVPGENTPVFLTDWHDLSGHGNDGTLTNMSGATGSGWSGSGTILDPYGVDFDGVDDFVVYQLSNTIVSFSIEEWVLIPAYNTNRYALMSWHGNSPSPSYCYLLLAFGAVYFSQFDNVGAGAGPYANISSGLHHIIGTTDGTVSNLYFDGVLVDSSGTVSTITQDKLWVACDNGLGDFSPITVPSHRIYLSALTAPQVADNFAAGPQASAGVWGDGVTPGAVLELVAAYGNAFVGG